jgi:predicted SprT family Zn-dependent metalloprotease
MKIIIKESQYRILLNEDVVGVDNFMNQLMEKFPEISEHEVYIKETINKSGVQEIEFKNLKLGVSGISLHNKLIINSDILLRKTLSDVFYVIFHEIAHQYQYKKYGIEKMYGTYQNDANILRSIDWLRNVENVADQYGMRKCRELYNLGVLESEPRRKVGAYENYTDHMYYEYINRVKEIIGDKGIDDPEKISELLYNWVINKKEV